MQMKKTWASVVQVLRLSVGREDGAHFVVVGDEETVSVRFWAERHARDVGLQFYGVRLWRAQPFRSPPETVGDRGRLPHVVPPWLMS
jgi:hypothetical protein